MLGRGCSLHVAIKILAIQSCTLTSVLSSVGQVQRRSGASAIQMRDGISLCLQRGLPHGLQRRWSGLLYGLIPMALSDAQSSSLWRGTEAVIKVAIAHRATARH